MKSLKIEVMVKAYMTQDHTKVGIPAPYCYGRKYHCYQLYSDAGVMVFNATFNNISAISWQSVLLVEETGVPGENH